MSSKPAPSPEVVRSQEAAFIEHYEWLIRWALQFSRRDRERAEDLVQQVFAQFAIAHTDLSAVHNVPAYLYTTLRNTHISEVRLASRTHGHPQSIVDYSIADTALGASDPYTLFQTHDELRRVCQYACLRKQSSRAGSVLILRFFHGYHLSEIAAVLGTTCQAVRQSLKIARNEARLFLDDPSTLKFIDRTQNLSAPLPRTVCAADELLADLRRAIFRSCEGNCLDSRALNVLYVERLIVNADNSTLAHIVSCTTCLDRVNRKLGLPLLAERHPADALGPNNNWRGGPGGPRDGGGSDNGHQPHAETKRRGEKISTSFLLQCRRRATELFEHHPRELCVSVNGHVLGSQSVSSQISRLRLDVTITEELNFIEVLSEERVRLVVLTIQPPPDGEPTQQRRVMLSEGRYIEVTLSYGHPWPMVEVVYEDPGFTADSLSELDGVFEPEKSHPPIRQLRSLPRSEPEYLQLPAVTPAQTALQKLEFSRGLIPAGLFAFFRKLNLLRWPLWTNPKFISAIVSLVLVSALVTFWLNPPTTVTAANLLDRASASEMLPAAADLAIHRVIEFDQRSAAGEEVRKNRIEIWRDRAKGLSVRRLYDGDGRLLASEWIGANSKTDGKPLRRIYL